MNSAYRRAQQPERSDPPLQSASAIRQLVAAAHYGGEGGAGGAETPASTAHPHPTKNDIGGTVTVLVDRITAVLQQHHSKQHADTTSRPGFRIWRDGCSGCEWLGARADHPAHVAEQVAAELQLTEERHWVSNRHGVLHHAIVGWTAVEETPTAESLGKCTMLSSCTQPAVKRLITGHAACQQHADSFAALVAAEETP